MSVTKDYENIDMISPFAKTEADVQKDSWEKTGKEANKQKARYQITINNPLDYGYSHTEIKKRLHENFKTLEYFAMSDEITLSGTPHTHIYVCFTSRVRWKSVKRQFPEAHIEPAVATTQDNIDYLKKQGKWAETAKAETSLPGTFEEDGKRPVQKGRLGDMEELYQLVKNGYSNAEILEINNDYILNIDKLDKLRTTILTDKYKETRRLDMEVIYVTGETGTGKTRYILDTHGDADVYRVSDYDHPFDNYACQPVLVFEEYRSQLRISDMLNYCDIYPIVLPARYANKYACYNTVYIVSNWLLEEQYADIHISQKSTWQAFLRRIKKVMVFRNDGEREIYNSTDEYFHREEKGKQGEKLLSEQEEKIPFEDEGDGKGA